MKKLFVLLITALSWGNLMAQRNVISLNDGWLFRIGNNDVAGAMKASETDGWRPVDVPHDFQIEQSWVAPGASEKADNSDAGANIKSRLSSRGFKEMGEGWYVRTFTPTEDMAGKRLLLDFEGIMYVADVYVNGRKVGGTDYGYVGFEIDVTRELVIGQPNTIIVRADTGEPRMSRWYTGGGLFRNVSLVVTDSQMSFVRHPLSIVTSGNRKVDITAEVRIATKDDQARLRVTVTDPDGEW